MEDMESAELLAYFRHRCGMQCSHAAGTSLIIAGYDARWHLKRVLPGAEAHEQEHHGLLERVEACAAQRRDLHALEWENRRRCDEVRELQQARRCAVPNTELPTLLAKGHTF